MKWVLSLEAEIQLAKIAEYLTPRNPQGAQRVEDALQDAFALIATYPHIGNEVDKGVRRFPLTRYPYLIFYRVQEAEGVIDVFTVRHAAQQEN